MNKGFTLVEMLLSLTIIVALLGISIPVFLGLNTRADVDAAKETLEIALRKAQAQARNQKNNSNWGVYVDSSNSEVIVFAGASYATRDTSLDESLAIPGDVVINDGSTQEIVFDQLTGDLEGSTQTITLTVGTVEKSVQVSALNGAIFEVSS